MSDDAGEIEQPSRVVADVGGMVSFPKSVQAERMRRARDAERAVAELLRQQGFHIVATNLQLGRLELDVVARREELVVVVEVRARSPGGWTTAFGSITPEKRRRVRLAAHRLWRRRYRNDPSVRRLRIDAAAVTFAHDGMHIHYSPAAF